MNTKHLLEKLIDNWPVKALCFVLACIIYFFHQVSLLETRTFSVPLEIRSEGNMIPVSGLEKEKYIKVKVRTKREQIPLITENDLTAYVDISSRTKEGSWAFPVSIGISEKMIEMDLDPLEITATPDNLKFDIQKKATKQVPVVSKVFGTPAHGYKALSIQLEPSHVFLVGPKFMLDEINEIPAGSVNIENSEISVSKILKAISTNAYISIIDDPHIKAHVPVVSEAMVKELADIEIKFNSLADEFVIEGDAKKVDLTIEGSVVDIEKFRMKNLSVYADLSFITEPGVYTVPVIVELSPAYSLAQSSLAEVEITVVKKEEKNTEDINVENEHVLSGESL
ncbi:YbbR-like domain-containing protein [Treponema sp.]|uniref:CdaR family protein n=1 Tax=Treponema sp. TaxID=166 RepID=UPI00298E5671|nr:CdaR family protein [Treponema sp.]MCQ2240616.1 CdaR family protein [Treponema sp.]